MRVLGIDPGLRLTGYALVDASRDRLSLVEAGVFRVTKGAGNTALSVSARLEELDSDFRAALKRLQPDKIAIESIFAHHKHPATAIVMGHARGVACIDGTTDRLHDSGMRFRGRIGVSRLPDVEGQCIDVFLHDEDGLVEPAQGPSKHRVHRPCIEHPRDRLRHHPTRPARLGERILRASVADDDQLDCHTAADGAVGRFIGCPA